MTRTTISNAAESNVDALKLVRRYEDMGLVVIGPLPRTLHYYALFGCTVGFDVVLTLYEDDSKVPGQSQDNSALVVAAELEM